MIDFTNLHVHSVYSMADSMAHVDQLFKTASELGQKSLALTEHGNCASLADGIKASKKYGVKFIPGCEFYLVDDAKKDKQKRKHLILLAKNEKGYRNLLKLNYEGFVNWTYVAIQNKVYPQIDLELIRRFSEGLVCLTACCAGPLAYEMFKLDENNKWNEDACYSNVANLAGQFKEIFGEDLYLEAQTHDLKKYKRDKKTGEIEKNADGEPIVILDQTYINRKLLQLSEDLGIKLVGTCDVHYIKKEDAKAHDLLIAIGDKKPLSDKNRHKYEVEEFYLKSGDEVFGFFSNLFSKETATKICANTMEIAAKCEPADYIETKEIRFPRFNAKTEKDYDQFLAWKKTQKFNGEVPEDHAYLRYKCIKEFDKKYAKMPAEKKAEYKKRVQDEIKVLEMHNFSSYMLIVSDFIRAAREKNISVGPGRGSVGGSLVAHLLNIHAVDPLQYGLIFERFHNKEKKAFPDIDTDFAPSGRDWVKNYVIEKYGKDKVAHVSNLSRMTSKVVVKDIARSLELGGGKSEAFHIANKITDSIPFSAKTFDDALKSKEFSEFCAKYPDVEHYGRKLTGLIKIWATHAGGIVISDIDLSTIVPLRYDKDGSLAVQYEKERCEQAGLIKMDMLGLEHLDIIEDTIKNSIAMGVPCPKPETLTFDDENVWDMICKGQTACVFQMGSLHMRNLCKRIGPRNIEDLSLVNALGRPSSEKSREHYIARRDGQEKIKYIHECLRPALQETLGICVYEEQLIKLAKYVAGWDLCKADGLRKLTKLKEKGKELAAKLKDDFIKDSMSFNKLSKEMAVEIWEEIVEPFEGYGFNKAHGIFYSINGYHTAYYKYHYPSAFMAAVLKSEVSRSSSNKEKIRAYKKEAERMGIKIITPDINNSGEFFTATDKNNIRVGLAAVKGVGAKAVTNIIETRNEHRFSSFADFLYRTNSSLVRKNVIQPLAKAGCFDSLKIARKTAHELYSEIRTKANKYAEKRAITGIDSWLIMDDFDYAIPTEEWSKKEILNGELEILGEYISGNIEDMHEGFFTGNGVQFKNLKNMADKTPVKAEAVIESISESRIQKEGKSKGNIFARCILVDKNKDTISMTVWGDMWKKIKNMDLVGKPICAICRVNSYKNVNGLVLERIEKLGK